MPISKRNIRGLQDINTLTGKVHQEAQPHKAYLRLSVLEMEKVRRGKEKESAECRIANINARFQEIETEKAALLKTLEKQNGTEIISAPEIKPIPALRRGPAGLKLRY